MCVCVSSVCSQSQLWADGGWSRSLVSPPSLPLAEQRISLLHIPPFPPMPEPAAISDELNENREKKKKQEDEKESSDNNRSAQQRGSGRGQENLILLEAAGGSRRQTHPFFPCGVLVCGAARPGGEAAEAAAKAVAAAAHTCASLSLPHGTRVHVSPQWCSCLRHGAPPLG